MLGLWWAQLLNSIAGLLGVGVAGSDFESIATVTVGAGGSSTISFSSIPSTYKHLQIRGLCQSNRGTYAIDDLKLNINSDTGANYTYHALVGSGSAASASGSSAGLSYWYIDSSSTATAAGSIFGAIVLDILDYANTSKNKTMRMLQGYDLNGTIASNYGTIKLQSSVWLSTSAITSISLAPIAGTAFNQNSHFALYGIKG